MEIKYTTLLHNIMLRYESLITEAGLEGLSPMEIFYGDN